MQDRMSLSLLAKTYHDILTKVFYFFFKFRYVFIVISYYLKENIALGKPTWQEHPWPDPNYYSGDNAVDGSYTNRSLAGGQCSISAIDQYTATWRVDLGNVFSISHINIYYLTDNEPSMNFLSTKN